jgi:hypothetical protein
MPERIVTVSIETKASGDPDARGAGAPISAYPTPASASPTSLIENLRPSLVSSRLISSVTAFFATFKRWTWRELSTRRPPMANHTPRADQARHAQRTAHVGGSVCGNARRPAWRPPRSGEHPERAPPSNRRNAHAYNTACACGHALHAGAGAPGAAPPPCRWPLGNQMEDERLARLPGVSRHDLAAGVSEVACAARHGKGVGRALREVDRS